MDKHRMAENLKALRKDKGETQKETANAVGVSESAYSQYELGAKVPRDDKKVAIAKHFKQSVQAIFFDNNTH